MAREIKQPPMTEPALVPCHFVEGANIEIRDEFVRIVGWIDLETAEGWMPERRIVVRASMPLTVARALVLDLRKALSRGGH